MQAEIERNRLAELEKIRIQREKEMKEAEERAEK